ncbi:MAG: hypothetical protein D6707_00620, partial [Bacteroidetes bacterium]
MKKLIWIFLAILVNISWVFAQIHNPVKWKYKVVEKSPTQFELQFIAKIEPGWHLYSQHLPSDEGPVATAFNFNENPGVKFIGSVKEPSPHTEYDPNFDMQLSYFENQVVFRQLIETQKSVKITGELTYMVCDSVKCLPPEYVPFEFNVTPDIPEKKEDLSQEIQTEEPPADNQIYNPVEWKKEIKALKDGIYEIVFTAKIENGWHVYSSTLKDDEGPVPSKITLKPSPNYEVIDKLEESGELKTEYDPNFDMNLTWAENILVLKQKIKALSPGFFVEGELQYMTCDSSKCLPPEYIPFKLEVKDAAVSKIQRGNNKAEVKRSFIGIFIAGFLGGLLALLTPCVFPMIPLTVSFFTKQSKTRSKGIINAVIYGISIIVIYVLLGYGVTAIFGADAMNALSTNVWFNLAFFILLTVFAISFFGAFEITLPSSWVNKVDS